LGTSKLCIDGDVGDQGLLPTQQRLKSSPIAGMKEKMRNSSSGTDAAFEGKFYCRINILLFVMAVE
jgi:hypothetical protein